MMKRFLFLMLLAAGFAACSDEEETLGGKDIQFAEGTSDKIEVYADETEGTAEGGISFTTTGPWRATVTPVTKAGGADWLSVGTKAEGETSWVAVVPDHGDEAGAYSIRIELGVNATGADRSATITIMCGATTITITVTQKGTTESGEVPEEPAEPDEPSPSGESLITGLYGYYEQSPDGETTKVELKYDGEGRLVEWNEVNTDYDGTVYEDRITYEYGDGVVDVVFHNDEGYTMRAYLDENGRAERMEEWGGKYVTELEYDAEGYLVRMEDVTNGDWEEYVWENGNLTEYHYGDESGEEEVWTYTYYEELENRGNFDLLFDSRPGWCGELMIAGLLGVQSKNLVKTERGSSEWAYKDEKDYEYETDGAGRVVKMVVLNAGVETDENPMIMEVTYDRLRN